MPSTNLLRVRQPRHFDAFRCIGPDCEDTCCVGWTVYVDKSTYDKYQTCADPTIGSALRTLTQINEAHSTDDDHAKVVLNGASCSFLSEGLCSIQRQLGESYLPNMCATYPRVTNRVGDVLQRSLDLSCPEAARVALLDPTPIQFEERAFEEGTLRSGNIPSLDPSRLQDFPDLRHQVIAILQNRSHPISKRLSLLGGLCEKLDETESGDAVLHETPEDPTRQLHAVLDLIVARLSSDYNPPSFLDCYKQFVDGIQWTAASTDAQMCANYREAYVRYYRPLMRRHEYILENYLVNYAHRTLFPFGVSQSNQTPVMRQYMLMIAYFAITRTLLIGMAGHQKSVFGVEHAIKTIQACSKTFEHSLNYPARVIEILSKEKMTTPASLRLLILD